MSSAATEAAARRWDRVYLALYALYIGLGLAARLLGWIHGDAEWFVTAARHVLDGSFDLYSFRANPGTAPPLGSPYAYSPFMALLIAPFVGLADALGWAGGAERLMAVPLLLADVLAMDQLRRLVRTWCPAADERFLFLGIGATLGLTGFWIATAFDGHDEGLILLGLLLTLRLTPRSLLWGGVCAGLTLAAKQTAALMLAPLALVLLTGGLTDLDSLKRENAKGRNTRNEMGAEGARGENGAPGVGDAAAVVASPGPGGLRAVLLWGGLAAGVFGLFMLPAALRNWDAVWYAFAILPTRLELFGAGLPIWIDRGLQMALPAPEYAVQHAVVVEYANLLLLGSMILPAIVISWAARRGAAVTWPGSRLLALVAFGAIAQVIFAKWATGHYYQVPLALVLLWDTVRTAPRPDQPTTSGLNSFPWLGLGAALAFRSITQLGTPGLPGKDALIFILFAALAGLTLYMAYTTHEARHV